MTRNITGLIVMLLLVGITACADTAASTAPQATNTAQPTATNTPSPLPTDTPSPTNTPTTTSTSTPTAVPTSTPTATTIPSASPTPEPVLVQLTEGGCCVQPSFSPDGEQVVFIDKPSESDPVGIYGVNLADTLPATPQLVSEIVGFRSPDFNIVATIDADFAQFTNEATGESWQVDTGGNWPRYAPDASQVLWTATDREGPYDQRRSDIWLAELDGSNPQRLLSLYGGGYQNWLPDGNRVLLVGRDQPSSEQQNLIIYDIANDRRINLVSHKRLRGIEMSPGGEWIAFFVDFADEPENRGLWVVNSDGTEKKKLDIPGFGGYGWRDDNMLLLIPMRQTSTESMRLWAIDVTKNQTIPLTDPQTYNFSISNGDWEVSPDGKQVIFVNSTDQNIWLMDLPD